MKGSFSADDILTTLPFVIRDLNETHKVEQKKKKRTKKKMLTTFT